MSVLNTGLQLEITIDNVVTFVTALSPIILTIFFLLNSALNFDKRFLMAFGFTCNRNDTFSIASYVKTRKAI